MPADLQALVRAPAWRWMPGMRGSDDAGRAFRVRTALTSKHDGIVDYEPCPYTFGGMTRQLLRPVASRPDLTDPATLGCMLALAREAWSDPTLHLQPFEADYCGEPRTLWVIASKPIGENPRYLSVDDGLEADGGLTCEWVDHIVHATWFRAEGDALAAAIIAAPVSPAGAP